MDLMRVLLHDRDATLAVTSELRAAARESVARSEQIVRRSRALVEQCKAMRDRSCQRRARRINP